jgi:hypothetical protein
MFCFMLWHSTLLKKSHENEHQYWINHVWVRAVFCRNPAGLRARAHDIFGNRSTLDPDWKAYGCQLERVS